MPPGGPVRRRAVRKIHPEWQHLQAGDVIPDYGGKNETFQVAQIQAPESIVYTSQRGKAAVTWSITLEPIPADAGTQSRVFLRLRMAPVRWKRFADTGGEFIDALTVAGIVSWVERTPCRKQLVMTPERH